ncbi:hypothetical protein [Thalassovita sp.]|uniref:DUF7697 family protein n=1 Tax=Thalassovita sp. TaxID=1979401 RepID=UPI0029DE8B6C|nr:hypothetical protein [Thalassovita sp.]
MHAPQSIEGWQVWDLVQRSGGQLRVAGGLAPQVLGFDMTAVLALAGALGVPPLAVGELVPAVEAAMVRRMNEAGEADPRASGFLP